MSAPMTLEQLAFARVWVEGFASVGGSACVPVQLLAEVDRLRAQVAAVRAAVDRVDQSKTASIMVSAIYGALASGEQVQPDYCQHRGPCQMRYSEIGETCVAGDEVQS